MRKHKENILVNKSVGALLKRIISNKTTLAYVITSSFLISSNTYAEERQGLLLNAAAEAQYDDNILRKKDDKTSDSSIAIIPEAQYLTHFGKHLFAVTYEGEYAVYRHNSKFNYDNHDIALSAKLDHSQKFKSSYKLSYKNEIEEAGSTNSSTTFLDEFNQTEKKRAKAEFSFGRDNSIGELRIGLDHKENRYTNNFQEYRDVDLNTLSGAFYFRVAPKTRLFLQASISDHDYITQTEFPDQGNQETLYIAGIIWEMSTILTGSFQVGYQEKDYDKGSLKDNDGLFYILDTTWKPNNYSTIRVAASRMSQDSSQAFTSAFITNSYTLDITHKITERTKLKAHYTHDNDDIINVSNRTDKRHNVILGVDHSLLNWLNISLDYQYIERSSDFSLYDYKANIIGLSVSTTFK